MTDDPWYRAAGVSPEELEPARLTVHHAIQPLASLANVAVPAKDDDSHTALHYSGGALWTAILSGGRRAGLRVDDLVLVVQGPDGDTVSSQDVAGHTVGELEDFLKATCEVHALEHPGYELPDHPSASGAPFVSPSVEALHALAGWFSLASRTLDGVVKGQEGSTPVRCWPHHFDIATLIVLEGEGQDMKSVGVGLSPGDGGVNEPYWYVNAWPAPSDPTNLPELPAGGRWNREGWFGAVLEGSSLIDQGDPAESLDAWLAVAIPTCQGLARAG